MSIANFHAKMATNVHWNTNATQLKRAVTPSFVVKHLRMPTVLVYSLARMAVTNLALPTCYVTHRRRVLTVFLRKRQLPRLWTWEAFIAEGTLRMLQLNVLKLVPVDLALSVLNLASNILVSPALRAKIRAHISVVLPGTTLHRTVSFHVNLDYQAIVQVGPFASHTLHATRVIPSCVEAVLTMLRHALVLVRRVRQVNVHLENRASRIPLAVIHHRLQTCLMIQVHSSVDQRLMMQPPVVLFRVLGRHLASVLQDKPVLPILPVRIGAHSSVDQRGRKRLTLVPNRVRLEMSAMELANNVLDTLLV